MAGPSYRERVDAALRGEFPEDALDVASAAFHASLGDLWMVWGEVVQHLAGQPAEVRARRSTSASTPSTWTPYGA